MSEKHLNADKPSSPKLSLSMIVKNEERFLEGCLHSVQGIVDEMVIVDTGSTDSTKEIAARYGAKIFESAWVGDFAAARNLSLSKCSGEWILYLDADERLAQGQIALLKQMMSEEDTGAYSINIESDISSQQGTVRQSNPYPRLFRRLPGVEFEGRIHEQIVSSLQRLNLKVQPSPVKIVHLGYAQGAEVLKKKADRNIELLRAQLKEDPGNAYARFQLGNSLAIGQQYDEAKGELEQSLRSRRLPISCQAVAYGLLAEVELKRGNLPDAISNCRKSLQVAPRQFMAHWFLALAFCDLKQFAEALVELAQLETLLDQTEVSRSDSIAADLVLRKEEVQLKLAYCYEQMGDNTAAIAIYGRLLKVSQDSDEAAIGFLRCTERTGSSLSEIERLVAQVQSSRTPTGLLFLLAWNSHNLNDSVSALQYIDNVLQNDATNLRAYVLSIRWRMEVADMSGAERMFSIAEGKKLGGFELHKCGLELSLKRGDLNSAFRHLELMTQTTGVDLTPVKKRITAIAERLAAVAA